MRISTRLTLAKALFLVGTVTFVSGLLALQWGIPALTIGLLTGGLVMMALGFFSHRCPHCGGVLPFERWVGRECPHCHQVIPDEGV